MARASDVDPCAHVLGWQRRMQTVEYAVPTWCPAARLAQSAERKALNLVVVGSSPTVGVFRTSQAECICCSIEMNVANGIAEGKNPATRHRTRDHLIAAAFYSQMLYHLSYSRLVCHDLASVNSVCDT